MTMFPSEFNKIEIPPENGPPNGTQLFWKTPPAVDC